MEKDKLEKEILLSHGECNAQGLSRNISKPKNRLTKEELKKNLEENKCLVKAFQESIAEIEEFITEEYLFLLANPKAAILAKESDLKNNVSIKPGMLFSACSSGTNAISLAKRLETEIFLTPEQHYCEFLKKWYCFTIPINYQNKTIGFLDVSVVKKEMQEELKAITVLLKDRILKKLDKFKRKDELVELTCKQKEVLDYLSHGLTEREIASEMHCSINTVKYHKKIIFKELDVDSTRKAIVKGIKLGIINLDKISL
ncbi:MAG: LuxR C-terminal-related transcriptional regulator [Bacillota bacterium]